MIVKLQSVGGADTNIGPVSERGLRPLSPPAIRASEPVCGAAAVSAARRLYSAAPGRRSAAEPGQINPSRQFSSATETVGVPGQPSQPSAR